MVRARSWKWSRQRLGFCDDGGEEKLQIKFVHTVNSYHELFEITHTHFFFFFKITNITKKINTQPLSTKGLTSVLVLRWRLWLCCPLCSQFAVEYSVSSLGHAKEYETGLLLRMGLRKRMRTTRRRRQRRWGQEGSSAPDSCSHCCCSHWHSRCYPRGLNRCFHPSHAHPHPVAHHGSCSCQPCVVLMQP